MQKEGQYITLIRVRVRRGGITVLMYKQPEQSKYRPKRPKNLVLENKRDIDLLRAKRNMKHEASCRLKPSAVKIPLAFTSQTLIRAFAVHGKP
jgi:hypothetical protein